MAFLLQPTSYKLQALLTILGIDPGTTSAGYAILDGDRRAPTLRAAGLLSVSSPQPHERLRELHQELQKLIALWNPRIMAIERLFFAKNQKTALAVAEARGAILLTAALAGLSVFEYTPLEIKKALTGDGVADKAGVKKIIHLTIPETKNLAAKDDVFDAIAVALVYCFQYRNHLI